MCAEMGSEKGRTVRDTELRSLDIWVEWRTRSRVDRTRDELSPDVYFPSFCGGNPVVWNGGWLGSGTPGAPGHTQYHILRVEAPAEVDLGVPGRKD